MQPGADDCLPPDSVSTLTAGYKRQTPHSRHLMLMHGWQQWVGQRQSQIGQEQSSEGLLQAKTSGWLPSFGAEFARTADV